LSIAAPIFSRPPLSEVSSGAVLWGTGDTWRCKVLKN